MKLCKYCKNRGKKRNCQFYSATSNYAEKCKDFAEIKQTNANRIQSMSIDKLANVIMCPNEMSKDVIGEAYIPCDKSDDCNCFECCKKWLQSEVEK